MTLEQITQHALDSHNALLALPITGTHAQAVTQLMQMLLQVAQVATQLAQEIESEKDAQDEAALVDQEVGANGC